MFGRLCVASANDLEQIQKCIGMEKMVSALPENVGQVSVKTFEALFHVLSVLAVNQVKDDVACAVCI